MKLYQGGTCKSSFSRVFKSLYGPPNIFKKHFHKFSRANQVFQEFSREVFQEFSRVFKSLYGPPNIRTLAAAICSGHQQQYQPLAAFFTICNFFTICSGFYQPIAATMGTCNKSTCSETTCTDKY